MISMIVAVNIKFNIGKDNELLYRIKDDLKRFKEITTNHKIIMGRKTYESIGHSLPNRTNIVITHNILNFAMNVKDENIIATSNIQELIDKYKDSEEEVFVIGGQAIYEEFKNHVSKIYMTQVIDNKEGNKQFPVNMSNFEIQESFPAQTDEESGLKFIFINYVKKC